MTPTSVLITKDHPTNEEIATSLERAIPTLADIHSLKRDEEKASIGIQEVHDWLCEFGLHPYGESQWGVIEEAHTLTLDAQQALLKALEEPPQNTWFILGTQKPLTLLPTIRSRCITITLKEEAKDSSEFEGLLRELENASIATCLKLAESVGKTREEAKNTLEGLLILSRTKLLAGEHSTTASTALLRSRDQLEHNVNTRLVLEHAFFVIAGHIQPHHSGLTPFD